jgi:hypothetical protein
VLRRARHPKSADRFRSLLALWSLPQLLGGFLVLLLVLGALLGFGYWRTGDGPEHEYEFWFRESVLLLAGLATTTTQEDESGAHAALQLAGAVGGVIFPALALGIVVFKAFVKDRVFVMRSKMALLDRANVEPFADEPDDVAKWLAFRLYSSTKLTLVGVGFEAYVRVKGKSPTGAPIVTNARLRLFKDHWPISLPHIPYTLYAPVRDRDLARTADGGVRLCTVLAGGREFEVADGCDILVIATGRVPELGTELVESHWFRADEELSTEQFAEISVDYPGDRKTWKVSRRWRNWGMFDARN